MSGAAVWQPARRMVPERTPHSPRAGGSPSGKSQPSFRVPRSRKPIVGNSQPWPTKAGTMTRTDTQRTSRLRRRSATAIAIIGVSVMTLSQTAWATKPAAPGKGNPAGNNDTIKINGAALQDGPRNEPHVSCTFNLTFSGYDEGDLQATVSFDLQAPTLR